jgi:hypothetical protein
VTGRVEGLPLRLDALQALLPEDLLELRVHELDAVQEPIEVGLLLRGHQR